jgi:RNA polymerase sigma factor (TIGR02999 family)
MTTGADITALLDRAAGGDARAADALLPLVYDELHALAGAYLRRERPDHTLQTTALVNEAYLKLVCTPDARFESRAHFLAVAAQAMRRILVNHARDRGRLKRGGGKVREALDDSAIVGAEQRLDLVALDEAMQKLSALDARKAHTVEMRFFGGMSVEEIANVQNVGTATVKRDWNMARAWLLRELTRGEGAAASAERGEGGEGGQGD